MSSSIGTSRTQTRRQHTLSDTETGYAGGDFRRQDYAVHEFKEIFGATSNGPVRRRDDSGNVERHARLAERIPTL